MPEAPFRPTDELFMDPTSGQRLRVYLNPATGERRYFAEESRALDAVPLDSGGLAGRHLAGDSLAEADEREAKGLSRATVRRGASRASSASASSWRRSAPIESAC